MKNLKAKQNNNGSNGASAPKASRLPVRDVVAELPAPDSAHGNGNGSTGPIDPGVMLPQDNTAPQNPSPQTAPEMGSMLSTGDGFRWYVPDALSLPIHIRKIVELLHLRTDEAETVRKLHRDYFLQYFAAKLTSARAKVAQCVQAIVDRQASILAQKKIVDSIPRYQEISELAEKLNPFTWAQLIFVAVFCLIAVCSDLTISMSVVTESGIPFFHSWLNAFMFVFVLVVPGVALKMVATNMASLPAKQRLSNFLIGIGLCASVVLAVVYAGSFPKLNVMVNDSSFSQTMTGHGDTPTTISIQSNFNWLMLLSFLSLNCLVAGMLISLEVLYVRHCMADRKENQAWTTANQDLQSLINQLNGDQDQKQLAEGDVEAIEHKMDCYTERAVTTYRGLRGIIDGEGGITGAAVAVPRSASSMNQPIVGRLRAATTA